MRDEIVETMARQLAAINSPASQIEDSLIVYKVEAVCLIRALESAGYRIVGRDATEGMLGAMRENVIDPEQFSAHYVYQAAFDAAPVYGEQP